MIVWASNHGGVSLASFGNYGEDSIGPLLASQDLMHMLSLLALLMTLQRRPMMFMLLVIAIQY